MRTSFVRLIGNFAGPFRSSPWNSKDLRHITHPMPSGGWRVRAKKELGLQNLERRPYKLVLKGKLPPPFAHNQDLLFNSRYTGSSVHFACKFFKLLAIPFHPPAQNPDKILSTMSERNLAVASKDSPKDPLDSCSRPTYRYPFVAFASTSGANMVHKNAVVRNKAAYRLREAIHLAVSQDLKENKTIQDEDFGKEAADAPKRWMSDHHIYRFRFTLESHSCELSDLVKEMKAALIKVKNHENTATQKNTPSSLKTSALPKALSSIPRSPVESANSNVPPLGKRHLAPPGKGSKPKQNPKGALAFPS